jgi:hypothetical protein
MEMVDKVADDDVEPKPAKKEGSGVGSGDVKPNFNLKPFKVQIPIQARIGKIEEPKPVCHFNNFFLLALSILHLL